MPQPLLSAVSYPAPSAGGEPSRIWGARGGRGGHRSQCAAQACTVHFRSCGEGGDGFMCCKLQLLSDHWPCALEIFLRGGASLLACSSQQLRGKGGQGRRAARYLFVPALSRCYTVPSTAAHEALAGGRQWKEGVSKNEETPHIEMIHVPFP